MLPAIFEQRGIRFQRGFTLAKVDPDRRIAYSEEGVEQPFDILMATPPIRAVDAVLESGASQAPDNETGCRPITRPCRSTACATCT